MNISLKDGLLLLDKPEGVSSHDLVSKLRKILGIKSIGHCGTLDPLATGLMVMLVGEATKISQYILEKNKSYEVEFQLGIITDTYDITGKILSEKTVHISEFEFRQKILNFSGEFEWPVPAYSAVKVNGEKLYELARAGKTIENVPVKKMSFFSLEVLSISSSGRAKVRIHCSKGSFIRSWVYFLGEELGTGAVMLNLRRLSSEPFLLKNAQTLEEIATNGPRLIDIQQALSFMTKKTIQGFDEHLLRNGQISTLLRQSLIADVAFDQVHLPKEFQICSKNSGKLMAIIGYKPMEGFQIRRVFNL